MKDVILELINEVKTIREADIILEAAKKSAVKRQDFLLAAQLRDIQHNMWINKVGSRESPHGITKL